MKHLFERQEAPPKRLRILLFGTILLCVLVGSFFALSFLATPVAHASEDPYRRGFNDGALSCSNDTVINNENNFSAVGDRSRYDNGWVDGVNDVKSQARKSGMPDPCSDLRV